MKKLMQKWLLALAASLATLAGSSSAAVAAEGSGTRGDDNEGRGLAAEYLRQAAAFKARKDYDQAKRACLRARAADPRSVKPLTELAWLCNETGDHDEAGAACLLALDLDERCADAWREVGFALLKKDEPKKAVEALTIALVLNPRDHSAYRYRAEAFEKLGMDDLADKDRARLRELLR